MLAVLAVRVLTADDDRVPAGVSIAGIPVGGLTAAQAERAVAARAEPPARQVEIVLAGEPGFPLQVPLAELAPTPRATLAVQDALDQPSVADRFLSEIGVRERTRDLPLRYRPEPAALDARVAAIAAQVDRPAVPANVVVRASKLEIAAAAARARGRPRRAAPAPGAAAAAARGAGDRGAAGGHRRRRPAGLRAGRRRSPTAPVAVRGAGAGGAHPAPARCWAPCASATENGQIAVRLDRNAIVAAVAPAFAGVVRPAVLGDLRGPGHPGGGGRRRARGGASTARPSPRAHRAAADGGGGAGGAGADRPRAQHRRRAAAAHPRAGEPVHHPARLLRAARDQHPAGRRRSWTARSSPPARPSRSTAPWASARARAASCRRRRSARTTCWRTRSAAASARWRPRSSTRPSSPGCRSSQHTPHGFWITRYPAGREATVSWGGPEMIVQNDWPAASS